MLVKDKFHALIDQIEDERALESYLNLIMNLNTSDNGKLYATLTNVQKDELEVSYLESFDKSNLISNEEVKDKYAKWL